MIRATREIIIIELTGYELRGREGRINYGILYFFHGKDVAILAQGLTKQGKVPDADIKRAIDRRKRYEKTRKSTRRASRSSTKRLTSDALEIIDRYVIGQDGSLRHDVEAAEFELEVAQLIYNARTSAGLTQSELAKLIGSNQSVISRLEDADYEGHSLSMLRRIGDALGQRLKISFVPKRKPTRRTA